MKTSQNRGGAAVVSAVLAVLLGVRGASVAAAQGWPELRGPVAIRNVTAIPRPGERLENATILIVGGRIAAVGGEIALPPGTRELDGAGLFAYAGFVDGLSRAGVSAERISEAEEQRVEGEFPAMDDGPLVETSAANRNGIFARRRAEDLLSLTEETFARQREAGLTAALVVPPRGIFGGSAAVVALGPGPLRESVLREGVAQAASFGVPPQRALRIRGSYPATVLGVVAQARQALADAQWYEATRAWEARNPASRGALPLDRDLAALAEVLGRKQPLIWEANTRDEIDRVLRLADEFGFAPIIAGGREAWKAADVLKRRDVPVILAVEKLAEPRKYELSLEKLRRGDGDKTPFGKNWSQRPFHPAAAYDLAREQRAERLRCAAVLEQHGLRWCLSALALERPGDLLPAVRELIEQGLSAEAALRALTVSPAELAGVRADLGELATGLRGNVTVLTQPLEHKDAKVRYVVVDGRVHEFDADAAADRPRGPAARRRDPSSRTPPGGVDTRPESAEPPPEEEPEAEAGAGAAPPRESAESEAPASQASQPATPLERLLAHEPNWPIEHDAARVPPFRTGGDVLLTNAYVITVSGHDLPEAAILVRGGKIAGIGAGLSAPAGVMTIDLRGRVVMPGIIDPHSHMALESVNEWSASVTPEVRCEDVVVHDDDALFRALAGGCTTIHFMHGSANTIGGQCAIMKLRYGRPADEMVLHDRRRTVKWALGENVIRPGKRGNRRDPAGPLRFPGTRMGVEATLRRALAAGQQYATERAAYEAALRDGSQDPRPLRRDLRLEALADILAGRIWVNTHCYRADEILRLIQVAEDFGIRIAVLHHVLEGYRIMPEIARHGAGTATFADWWAYKIEAYDAVPHNAGMLLEFGINSALKSDSGDLVRHMNLEAAKAMKYAGLTPNEALRLITLNPARQFGLEGRIGSIEIGKDADLAVYDGHPLDTWARCVMTLIDGEVYFADGATPEGGFEAPARPVRTFAPRRVESRPAPFADLPVTDDTVFAITGATLHPVSGPAIENGGLVMRGGRIVAIGADVRPPPGARVLDARGLHVWPGLINAATQIGMAEIEQVDVTLDTGETGEYQPDVLAVSGLNPHSAMVNVARAEGITTALLVPTSPTVAGQAGLVDLDGWTLDEMLIDPRVGLVVTLPASRVEPLLRSAEAEGQEPAMRGATLRPGPLRARRTPGETRPSGLIRASMRWRPTCRASGACCCGPTATRRSSRPCSSPSGCNCRRRSSAAATRGSWPGCSPSATCP